MMKWRKKTEARPPENRVSGNDATESRAGVFRSLADFSPLDPAPVRPSAARDASAGHEQVTTKPVEEDASTETSSKAIPKAVRSPTSASSTTGPEAGGDAASRKLSSSAPGGEPRQTSEHRASVLRTSTADGRRVEMPDNYHSTYGDRDMSIYESTPAFRMEPILTSHGISTAANGSKTIITINGDSNSRLNGSTTLVINGDASATRGTHQDPRASRSNGHAPLVTNSESSVKRDSDTYPSAPVHRQGKAITTQTSGVERSAPENGIDNRLAQTLVTTPSDSPLSRASSNRTTDTEHSSGTGSSFYLSGGVGSPFSPLGSTTKLITQGTTRQTFKVDTGWLPAWATVFTVLSLVAGLGNVVRLPRVVALHGGGAFLVVYVAVMAVFGVPLVFLEIGLGQFCEQGAVKLWRSVPLFKGVGYVKMFASFLMAVYYPILMTISFLYMIWSTKGLPFQECVHDFIGEVPYNYTATGEECLHQTFLRPVSNDGMWFGVNVAIMFLIWALIMLCLFKDRKSFRMATYFLVIPIFLILMALLIENIVRDPVADGISQLFTIDWNVLLDIEVWYFATIQMFFSTHLGFGNILTGAGRLYPQSNAFWTATLFIISNLLLGILSVLTTYYYIGQLNIDVNNVKMPEVFIFTLFYDAATQVITPNNEVWAFFGYLVFGCTGLAAMLWLISTILEVMSIELKKRIRWEWWQKTGVVCAIGFLIGVPALLPYELELVHILDHYVIGRVIIASIILELIGIAWIYGCGTLYIDFEFILGYRLNPMWKVVWWITPVLFMMLEIWSLVSLPLTGLLEEDGDALWVYVTGWTLYFISWVIIIVTAIYQVSKQIDYNLKGRILSALKPTRKWGPVDTMYRHNWHQWRNQPAAPGERDYTLKRRGTKDYTHSLKRARSPQGLHFQTTLSAANTLRSNRGVDKLPYIIQDTGEHVCWRGNTADQSNNGTMEKTQTYSGHL